MKPILLITSNLCLLTTLIFLVKGKRVGVNYFLFFLLFTTLVDQIASYMVSKGSTTTALFNITTKIEFLYWSGMYLSLVKQRGIRSFSFFFVALSVSIIIIRFGAVGIRHFDEFSFLLIDGTIILLVVLFFLDNLLRPIPTLELNSPIFIFSIGNLFFYAGCFTYFLAYSVAGSSNEVVKKLYFIISALNIGLYLIYLSGLATVLFKKETVQSS